MSYTNRRNKGFTLIELTLVVAIIDILALMSIPNLKREGSGYSYQKKQCSSNIRVIELAIEMYNMDKDDKIHEMNNDVLQLLLNNGYLKEIPECPDKSHKNKYLSTADLMYGGFVYCEYHSNKEGITIKPGMTKSEYDAEQEQKRIKYERENTIRNTIIIVGIPLLFILIIFSATDKIKKTSKKLS